MKILPLSDLHGALPSLRDIPDCDLLLFAGDICPDKRPEQQLDWLAGDFRVWLEQLRQRNIRIVAIAGNHDFVFEKYAHYVEALGLPWTYLEDDETEVDGFRIWGTPWVPTFKNWAFCATDRQLEARSEIIPDGIDILICHSPPYGGGLDRQNYDLTSPHHGSTHAGDITINYAIRRVRPKLIVCGHIHEGRGEYEFNDSILINAAYLNEWYKEPQIAEVCTLFTESDIIEEQ